ncbi:MAG: hotdog fold thioesterase [Chitinophagaceae bacterium]|nr:hotdog fold thioesterase [Chitinophagaceae bacterium]
MIWLKKDIELTDLQSFVGKHLADHLGIKWLEIGADYLKATMPVDDRTKQPFGLLHGGASCVLAETLGSVGSALIIDNAQFICVGLEINANHVRAARDGFVTGTATPLHVGSSTHIWDIKIHDEKNKLVCVSRLTVAILKRQ